VVSFAATGKFSVRFGRNGARSLAPLNRVYTVLTQARTGPTRRSESNESMEHHCRKRALPSGQSLRKCDKRALPIGNNLRRLPIHAEDYVAGVRFACQHAPCTHD